MITMGVASLGLSLPSGDHLEGIQKYLTPFTMWEINGAAQYRCKVPVPLQLLHFEVDSSIYDDSLLFSAEHFAFNTFR